MAGQKVTVGIQEVAMSGEKVSEGQEKGQMTLNLALDKVDLQE